MNEHPMTDNGHDADSAGAAIRTLLAETQQAREQAAINAVEAYQKIAAAEEEVLRARSGYQSAWTAALDAGWTAAELRRLDLSVPEQPKKRRRRRRTTPPRTSTAATARSGAESDRHPHTEGIT